MLVQQWVLQNGKVSGIVISLVPQRKMTAEMGKEQRSALVLGPVAETMRARRYLYRSLLQDSGFRVQGLGLRVLWVWCLGLYPQEL